MDNSLLAVRGINHKYIVVGGLSFLAPDIYVGEYVEGGTATVSRGRTGSVTVQTSSGTTKTLTFTKGIMTSAL